MNFYVRKLTLSLTVKKNALFLIAFSSFFLANCSVKMVLFGGLGQVKTKLSVYSFAFQIGLPAKSGVSGAMVVVIPNLMGICLWGPPLDKMGNSVRGVSFCQVNMVRQRKFLI